MPKTINMPARLGKIAGSATIPMTGPCGGSTIIHRPNFKLEGAHENLTCSSCHRTSANDAASQSAACIACHRADDEAPRAIWRKLWALPYDVEHLSQSSFPDIGWPLNCNSVVFLQSGHVFSVPRRALNSINCAKNKISYNPTSHNLAR